jgi:hypothetical protein
VHPPAAEGLCFVFSLDTFAVVETTVIRNVVYKIDFIYYELHSHLMYSTAIVLR